MYVDQLLSYMSQQFKDNILANMVKRKGILLKIPDYSESWQNAYQKWFKFQKKKRENSKHIRKFTETKRGKEVSQSQIHSKKSVKKKEKEDKKLEELEDLAEMELKKAQSEGGACEPYGAKNAAQHHVWHCLGQK